MENESKLILTENDFQKLSSLIMSIKDTEIADLLEEELGRASVVPPDALPKDVVSMNSKVKYVDLETKKETVITLVYPHEANIEESKVSVLAPIGSALIGLRVGQVIKWAVPNDKEKSFKVVEVISQQEPSI